MQPCSSLLKPLGLISEGILKNTGRKPDQRGSELEHRPVRSTSIGLTGEPNHYFERAEIKGLNQAFSLAFPYTLRPLPREQIVAEGMFLFIGVTQLTDKDSQNAIFAIPVV